MDSPLEQLLREQGDELSARIAAKLGVSLEEAAKVLPAAAAAVLARFDPEGDGAEARRGAESLEGILGGAGAEMGDRVGARLGIGPEEAAAVVPVVLPVVLRFLVRRVPYGGMALSLLARTVEQQGYGSLDEIAVRVVKSSFPRARAEGPPSPSLATRLGRLAGKYFPSGDC